MGKHVLWFSYLVTGNLRIQCPFDLSIWNSLYLLCCIGKTLIHFIKFGAVRGFLKSALNHSDRFEKITLACIKNVGHV